MKKVFYFFQSILELILDVEPETRRFPSKEMERNAPLTQNPKPEISISGTQGKGFTLEILSNYLNLHLQELVKIHREMPVPNAKSFPVSFHFKKELRETHQGEVSSPVFGFYSGFRVGSDRFPTKDKFSQASSGFYSKDAPTFPSVSEPKISGSKLEDLPGHLQKNEIFREMFRAYFLFIFEWETSVLVRSYIDKSLNLDKELKTRIQSGKADSIERKENERIRKEREEIFNDRKERSETSRRDFFLKLKTQNHHEKALENLHLPGDSFFQWSINVKDYYSQKSESQKNPPEESALLELFRADLKEKEEELKTLLDEEEKARERFLTGELSFVLLSILENKILKASMDLLEIFLSINLNLVEVYTERELIADLKILKPSSKLKK
ncbi:MAG: hypothetical protein H7A24_00260 [Leptospiraceae bacterium]|nr:hypothetical protein [Leptospiraceae bacterium]MCP5510284.1 hypothetical protein [Leptospiraceae bacterium]